MNTKITELINFLDEEIKIYQKVLKLSKEKTDVITKDKRVELEDIISEEEKLIFEVQKIEKAREALSQVIYSELGINSESGRIKDIITKLSPNEAKLLSQKREEFLELMKELKKMNEINSKLINNSLEFVNLRMKLMSGTQEIINNDYKATGKMNNAVNRTMFDIKL